MTTATYLVSPTLIPTSAVHLHCHTITVLLIKHCLSCVLDWSPTTAYKGELQTILHKAYKHKSHLKQLIFEIQAGSIFNSLFLDKVQEQLEGQEEKEGHPLKKRKLLGNGLPKLLTNNKIFTVVADHKAEQEQEKEMQVKRKADTEQYEATLEA